MKICRGLRRLVKTSFLIVMLALLLEGTAYSEMATTISTKTDDLSNTVASILAYLDLNSADDYDIIYSVYNYICQTVEYDWDAINNFPWDGESTDCGQTAYEALCEEKAVCAGIARAITLLLEEMDIPCKTVIGYQAGIGHAWNLVQLDEQWYFLDATADLGQPVYGQFLQSWDDLGDYAVSSESGFDIAEFDLANHSYVDNVAAQLDSYEGFSFNLGLGDITILSYTGGEKTVVIPSEIKGRKVKRLAQYCIQGNMAIEKLVVSEGIERINVLFVGSCPSLRSIELPSTANFISGENDAFVCGLGFVDACNMLETITVPESNPYLCVVDNVLYDKEMRTLICYPAKKQGAVFQVPQSVQRIGNDAFALNLEIEEVLLPNYIEYIGYYAFSQCGNLKRINIPEACTTIGQYAFQNTSVLELHLPAALEVIISPAFGSRLQTITVDEGNPLFYAVDDVLFSRSGVLILYAAKKEETYYAIPSGIKEISWRAFAYADNLEEIQIPSGVVAVGWHAFEGCMRLREVNLPETVEWLDEGVFFDCRALERLTIPASITMPNDSTMLANVTGTVIWGASGSSAQLWAEQYGYAFHDISTPWNASGICGDDASWLLTEDGVLQISGTGAMYDFDPAPWSIYTNMIKKVVISEGITSIGANAFARCPKITAVEIPDSVTSIGDTVFGLCTSLKSIDLPDSVTYLGHYVFWQCSALEKITLPENVNQLGCYAFWACSALEEVELPENLQSIGDYAFYQCLALKTIDLPTGLQVIGPRAFSECIALTSIEIPATVTVLREFAFDGCNSLQRVYLSCIPEECAEYPFGTGDVVIVSANPAVEELARSSGYAFSAICQQHSWDEGVYLPNDHTPTAGSIKYTCSLCGETKLLLRVIGDANSNGIIDLYDALLVLQYSAGWDVVLNVHNAEVNGDGMIGISDALQIIERCTGSNLVSALRMLMDMSKNMDITLLEIIEHPNDQQVTVGMQAQFTVTVAGDELQYQWYVNRNDGAGWCKLNDAASAAYTTSATNIDHDGYQYRCEITDVYGIKLTSDVAVLHVVLELPVTGDASTPMLWLAMGVLSLMLLVLLIKQCKSSCRFG